jgi:hypothetical protein
MKMYESYRQDGKLPATYEVIYGHAWKRIKVSFSFVGFEEGCYVY